LGQGLKEGERLGEKGQGQMGQQSSTTSKQQQGDKPIVQ